MRTRDGERARGPRRKRALAAVAALGVSLIAAACGPPVGGGGCNGPGAPPDAVTQTVFNATNASRAGIAGALSWNPQLYCLANEWSTHMGTTGSFGHRDLNAVINSPAYSGYHTLGENILRGPSSWNGNQMHQAWMGSTVHRNTILSPAYTSMAIAVYYAGAQFYATENFGG